jgi:hypothetical protein
MPPKKKKDLAPPEATVEKAIADINPFTAPDYTTAETVAKLIATTQITPMYKNYFSNIMKDSLSLNGYLVPANFSDLCTKTQE